MPGSSDIAMFEKTFEVRFDSVSIALDIAILAVLSISARTKSNASMDAFDFLLSVRITSFPFNPNTAKQLFRSR